MRLTLYTDYSLRVLIYLARRPDERVTINDLAAFYAVSRSHLVKVVHNLGLLGYISTTRGKGGGLALAKPASDIGIGEIVRQVEPDFELFECFNRASDQCVISHDCGLKHVFYQAQVNFLQTLDQYTLAHASDGTLPAEVGLLAGG